MYPYLSICTILRRNNSPRLWTAGVCDSNRVSLTSFPVLFGEEIVGREADKARSPRDWFLFNWAENISTIDLVVEANFSISPLRRCSRFSVADEPHPLMPQRYSPASYFQTGWILWSFTSNYTTPSLSPNPSCVLSPLPSSLTSKFSSSELHPSRLDSTRLDSSELDSDRKSSCSSQSLLLLSVSPFVDFLDRFFDVYYSSRRVRKSELNAACASCLVPLSEGDYLVFNCYTKQWLVNELIEQLWAPNQQRGELRSYLIKPNHHTSS